VSDALVIVDHGSRRPEAHAHLERIAAWVRERTSGIAVHVAHMELAQPSLASAIARCAAEGARRIVVHPLFLGPGRHLVEDIPRLVAETARAHPGIEVRISAAVGEVPAIADAILAAVGLDPPPDSR
jgi:sirohydrochlorin ferrochelatase